MNSEAKPGFSPIHARILPDLVYKNRVTSDSGVGMETTANTAGDKQRAYRQRLAANGNHQLIVALPRETVAFLDEIKERQGLRNRSQAVLQLIERGREVTQQ